MSTTQKASRIRPPTCTRSIRLHGTGTTKSLASRGGYRRPAMPPAPWLAKAGKECWRFLGWRLPLTRRATLARSCCPNPFGRLTATGGTHWSPMPTSGVAIRRQDQARAHLYAERPDDRPQGRAAHPHPRRDDGDGVCLRRQLRKVAVRLEGGGMISSRHHSPSFADEQSAEAAPSGAVAFPP